MLVFFRVLALVALATMTQAQAREAELTRFERATSIGATTVASGIEFQSLEVVPNGRIPIVQDISLPPLTASRSPAFNLEPCMHDGYTRAWWLSPEAEVRRAAHFETVARIACNHGLPTRLLDAVIAQESSYDFLALSRAGAMGMMQIMPGTARQLGLSNPWEPVANMVAGARYLREQLDRFGRIDLALAAYNAGPERRALRYGRIPAIPETQHYVRAILTNWGRLIELDQANMREPDRGELAMIAVRASGYRDVELIRYDGLNASNPM